MTRRSISRRAVTPEHREKMMKARIARTARAKRELVQCMTEILRGVPTRVEPSDVTGAELEGRRQ